MTELEQIHEMRNRTQLPLLKCKQYLIQAAWDLEKAIHLASDDYWKTNPFIMRD